MRWLRCFRCGKKIGKGSFVGKVTFPHGESVVEVELCAPCLMKVRAAIEFGEEKSE